LFFYSRILKEEKIKLQIKVQEVIYSKNWIYNYRICIFSRIR